MYVSYEIASEWKFYGCIEIPLTACSKQIGDDDEPIVDNKVCIIFA